jgi:regulator of replication initiation timing
MIEASQSKDTTIGSLKEHIMMLQAKLEENFEESKKLELDKQTIEAQLSQAISNAYENEQALIESTSLLALREQTITQLTAELEKSGSILQEKEAFVAGLETALDTANQRTIMIEA